MQDIPLGEWKAKYGRIFKVQIEDKEIYFRLLNVSEVEIYKKDLLSLTKNINSIILNNKSLSSAGSKFRLSDFVIMKSFPNTDDEMKERILHYRYSTKDDFVSFLISKLCSVFMSYNPDELKSKTLDQLLELTALAEMTIGKPILLYNKKGKGTLRGPDIRNDSKFKKPEVDELMEESTHTLQAAMSKFGKHVPTLSEVKKKKETVGLTDMQRQMKELNQTLK